jgi:hypothetical protein
MIDSPFGGDRFDDVLLEGCEGFRHGRRRVPCDQKPPLPTENRGL